MNKPHSLSPAARLELLHLFSERRLGLTVVQFDEHLDAVLEILEEANNERHRLLPDPDEAP